MLDASSPRPRAACPQAAIGALEGAAASILAIRAEEAEYTMRCQFVDAAIHRRSGTCTMAPHLRWFANGAVLSPGHWVTVPYGAVLTSPATVQGTYVVDASVAGEAGLRFGLLSRCPIRLVIEQSVVRSVECSEAAIQRHVERFVSAGNGCEKVGLLGLGANVGMPQALGELHHDVNMPGVHLSLGETFPLETGATWRARGQLGFAMADADVDLDGAPVIRRGRYVRFV